MSPMHWRWFAFIESEIQCGYLQNNLFLSPPKHLQQASLKGAYIPLPEDRHAHWLLFEEVDAIR